jgi:adenosylhomocysteine nucleosidase
LTGVGVVAALEAEARTLGPALRRQNGLAYLGDGAMLAVSGMGGALAAAAARRLVDAGASGLMSFGLAGGLDPSLSAGRVVLPDDIISRDGTRIPASAEWRRHLGLAIAHLNPATGGKLLTSARPIATIADKAAAFGDTGAVAVDMESLAVAEIAASRGLPFIAVRVVVDGAADRLPASIAAASRGGPLRVLPLIGGLIAAPRDLPDLIRLARRYRVAIRSLEAVARAGHAQMHFLDAHLA